MSPDTDSPGLRRSLHEAADRLDVPAVDVEALRAGGRRHARRRTAVTALAAAAVVAVVVGTGVALVQDARRTAPSPAERSDRIEQSTSPIPPPQPATIADLPRGEPPGVPYVRDGTLYTPGVYSDMEGPGRLRELTLGGGVALGVHSVRGIVRVVPSGHYLPIGVDGSDVAVSPNGRWAAWLADWDGDLVRVQLWDLRDRSSVGIRVVPVRSQCCDGPVQMRGVDRFGRVFVTGINGTFVWDPRSDEVHQVGTEPYGVSQVLPDDVVTVRSPDSNDDLPSYTLGVVDQNGEFEPVQAVDGYDVRWAPDGSRPARSVQPETGPVQVDGDRVEVLDPETGKWVPMLAPSKVSLAGYLWKNGGHLLVTVYDAKQDYFWLRCDADDGGCVVAAELGTEGGDWTLPDR